MYSTGKTAQVDQEMSRYNIDILGLSEVRWPHSGKTALQCGKVILYSGRDDASHQEGVGVMLSAKAKKSLMEWKPISERCMYARLYTTTLKISLIVVYGPTNDNTEEAKERFLAQLQDVLSTAPKYDIKIIMGDFNAKVGSNNKTHENVMGKHGMGNRNDNGESLLEFCGINNLVITGTIFPHKLRHKISWISPDGRTENQIDHLLISKQHRTSIMDTRAMRGADVSSDHELIRSKIRIKLRKPKQKANTCRKKYDTTKLQQPEKRRAFSLELKNRFQVLEELDSVENIWESMEKGYIETANNILRIKENGQKPWISKDSWKQVNARKHLKQQITNCKSERLKNNLRSQYAEKDKKVKNSMRNDKRKWTEDLISQAERAANYGHMNTVYEITRVISNERKNTTPIIKDKTSKVLRNQNDRLTR
ncbi:craniofacial development protein 2-like [Mercenaria mercenaria]|uniref:craniofacial development protein 2-like n=1 Tax=Mercenaria mercenaria TaxID=6596 RepID=UPI00234EF533|nr:craniofacial development protein 2-like [Mercenaria mercenaria]